MELCDPGGPFQPMALYDSTIPGFSVHSLASYLQAGAAHTPVTFYCSIFLLFISYPSRYAAFESCTFKPLPPIRTRDERLPSSTGRIPRRAGRGASCCSALPAQQRAAGCTNCPGSREGGRRVAALHLQSRSGDGALRGAGRLSAPFPLCAKPRCPNQLKQSVHCKHFQFCEENNPLFLMTLNLLIRSCLCSLFHASVTFFDVPPFTCASHELPLQECDPA